MEGVNGLTTQPVSEPEVRDRRIGVTFGENFGGVPPSEGNIVRDLKWRYRGRELFHA